MVASNRVGNIVRQPSGSIDSPFITARASTRCAGVAVASSSAALATRGSAWMPAYTTALASRAASWNLMATSPSAEQDDLRERRQPVDRPVGILDQPDLLDRAVDGDVRGLRDDVRTALGGDLGQSLFATPGRGR